MLLFQSRLYAFSIFSSNCSQNSILTNYRNIFNLFFLEKIIGGFPARHLIFHDVKKGGFRNLQGVVIFISTG